MPYTISHCIAGIIIKRSAPKWFSMTGLVMGSMAPDFERFIKLEPEKSIGHTWIGLFLLGIPLSIIFSFLFHHVIKESAALHLPSPLNKTAYFFARNKWSVRGMREWVKYMVSIVVGFISHLFLDYFTHDNGTMFITFSVILLLLLFAYISWIIIRTQVPDLPLPVVTTKSKISYWMIVSVVIIAISYVMMLVQYKTEGELYIIMILPIAPVTGLFLGMIIASLLLKTGIRQHDLIKKRKLVQ